MSNYKFKNVTIVGDNVFGDIYGSYESFVYKYPQLNDNSKNLAKLTFEDEALSEFKDELLNAIAQASKGDSQLPKESKSLFNKIKDKVVELGSQEAASALIAYLLEKAPSWEELINQLIRMV